MDTIADPRQLDIEDRTGRAHTEIIAKAGPLATAAGRAMGVLSGSHIPILECVLFECSGHDITITGTDMEIGLSLVVPAAGARAAFVVKGSSLHDAVRRLAADADVTLTVSADAVRVKCGRFSVSLPTLPVADYPSIQSSAKPTVDVDPAELRRLLNTTRRFVSTETTRAYLCGVHLHPHEGGMRAVATDGGALAYATAPAMPQTSPVILPARTVAEILRLLPAAGAVRFGATDRLVFCETATERLVSKLIDGIFPEYERVIPQESQASFLVERAPFISTVERIAPFCEASTTKGGARSGIAQFQFSEASGLRIGTRISDDHDFVDGSYTGPDAEVGIMTRNVQVVGDASEGALEIVIHGDGAPVTISCPAVPGTLFVLMTARV